MLMPLAGCNAKTDTARWTTDDLFDSALEFTGLPVFENSDSVSALNNKYGDFQPFCFDSERIYFTNSKDGQYLYSYDGENSECLVEMPVRCLNYHNNCIYFLSDKKFLNFDGPYEGYLYKYDLSENKTEKLSDFLIDGVHVTDKGIFYIDGDENGKAAVYQFDESTGKGTPRYNGSGIHHLNGYYICFKPGGEQVEFFLTNNEETYRLPVKGMPLFDCIVNGKYYYKPSLEWSLQALDLTNGKNEELIPADVRISDYTVFDGTVYIISSKHLFKLCDGELKKLEYIDDSVSYIVLDNFAEIYRLFSGSNAMYTMIESTEGDERVYDFAEIVFTDDGDSYYLRRIT